MFAWNLTDVIEVVFGIFVGLRSRMTMNLEAPRKPSGSLTMPRDDESERETVLFTVSRSGSHLPDFRSSNSIVGNKPVTRGHDHRR